eukprot:COSAG01_NODE_24_length_37608_cov_19.303154_28_plen_62_part_00
MWFSWSHSLTHLQRNAAIVTRNSHTLVVHVGFICENATVGAIADTYDVALRRADPTLGRCS